jgi:hypothetical protein
VSEVAAESNESVVQQWLIELGRLWQARAVVLRYGGKRFGPPDEITSAEVQDIIDVDRLERMTDRIPDAAGWADLLATE